MGTLQIGQSMIIKANDFVQSDMLGYVMESNDLDQKVLLELVPSVTTAGIIYGHAVISPRLSKDGIDSLLRGKRLGCAVTWVPKGRLDLKKPFDTSWWRGGGAAITDVMLS